jgi:hypothetical protein
VVVTPIKTEIQMSIHIILDGYVTVKRTPETESILADLLEDAMFERLAMEENGDGEFDIVKTDDTIRFIFCPEIACDDFGHVEWEKISSLLYSLYPYVTEPAYIRVNSDGIREYIFLGDPDKARCVEAVDTFNSLWGEIGESAKDAIRGIVMREIAAKLKDSPLWKED